MANWNDPVLSSAYSAFLTALKDRGVDCAKMDFSAATNIPTGTVQYVAASHKFQVWNGASWDDIVLAAAGGGTGGTGGVGTLGAQAADAVNIDGGTVDGTTQATGIITAGVDVRLPMVSVTHDADQTFTNYVYAPFNTELRDTHAFHNTVTNNSRLTVPTGKAGIYLIGGGAYVTNVGSTITGWGMKIRKNGSPIVGEFEIGQLPAAVSSALVMMPSTVAYLNVGDYVELRIAVFGGALTTLKSFSESSPKFWMVRLGD